MCATKFLTIQYIQIHPCDTRTRSLLSSASAETSLTKDNKIIIINAKKIGNRAGNQKVAGTIPDRANYVVSLGKALHPTCLEVNVPVLTVSRSG